MKVRIALAALAGVATLATVGVAAAPSASASTTGAATVAHVVYSPPGCTVGQLSARLSGPVIKGHERSYVLTLTNISHQVCTVSGYPALQLLTLWKYPLPTQSVLVKSTVPAKVVLFPWQSATAQISFAVYGRYFGWNYANYPFIGPEAAYLEVTLPSTTPPWRTAELQPRLPSQHFILWIPGGPVQIVKNCLYETALTGHMPMSPR